MTERMDRRFAALRQEGRAALVTFTMAGDPDAATSLAILKALPKAGADVIELGMPFTDPMADGPAIQAAGLRALHAGQNMKKTLAIVREFRAGDDATPTTDDKRLPTVLTNTSGFVYYVSIAGITGSAAPNPTAVSGAVARIKRHTKLPVCVGFGVRTAEQARAIAAGADGVVVGSALVDAVSKSLGPGDKPTAATVPAVADLVRELAGGVRASRA